MAQNTVTKTTNVIIAEAMVANMEAMTFERVELTLDHEPTAKDFASHGVANEKTITVKNRFTVKAELDAETFKAYAERIERDYKPKANTITRTFTMTHVFYSVWSLDDTIVKAEKYIDGKLEKGPIRKAIFENWITDRKTDILRIDSFDYKEMTYRMDIDTFIGLANREQ